MSGRRFEVEPHTADKSIRAFGDSLKELFENAAFGMFSLMAVVEQYEPVESRRVEVTADDAAELLRMWLAELLYIFEVERVLFVEFEIVSLDDNHAVGVARGVPFSTGIEWLGSIVKAVTHHDLSLEEMGGRWEAVVVFDV